MKYYDDYFIVDSFLSAQGLLTGQTDIRKMASTPKSCGLNSGNC